jgi:hypothetical protein
MAYTSMDNIIEEISTNGKEVSTDYNKTTLTTVYTAGRTYDLSTLPGNPQWVQYGEFLINSYLPNTSFNWTTNGTGLAFTPGSGFVKTSGTGTTYTADSLQFTPVVGRFYRVQFTVSAWTSSNVYFTFAGVTGTNRAATGTFIEYITAASTATFVLNASINTGVWTVSNISVCEWGASSGSTNLCAQQIVNTMTPSLYNGGNVTPDYKHLLGAGIATTAATGVGTFIFVDLLACVPYMDANSSSAQTVANQLFSGGAFTADAGTDIITHSNINILNYSRVQVSNSGGGLPAGLSASTNYWVVKVTDLTFKLATTYANAVAGTTIDITSAGTGTHTVLLSLPRYTNGAGVKGMLVSAGTGYNAVSTVGATAHNILYTYTNSEGEGSRQNPQTVACTASATLGHITHAGVAASNFGPGLPLANQDNGMLQINTLQLSAATATANTFYHFVLFRELARIQVAASTTTIEKDFLNQMPSLPRIYDGATIGVLYVAGGATAASTSFLGYLRFGWG